ncbi:MAG TPA: carboxypeptidase-like regulatory domain-containing protein [Pyrinomonadaceae bacterium]|jgi:hypothetical protein
MRIFKQIAACAFLLAFAALAAFAQSATGGVKGKVRNAKGSGLEGVTITARRDGQDLKSVKSDAKGNFQLTGLAPGVYNFVFEKSGYGAGLKANVEIKSNSVISLGDNLALMVDQGSLVLLNASVFNQDGRSVTGAKVEVERVGGDGSAKKIATGYTNVSGEFALRQPEGAAKYRVTATLKGVSGSKEIAVDSAGRYSLAITLNLPKEEK